jgi:sorbitol-specific phosphotransferase system component IIC
MVNREKIEDYFYLGIFLIAMLFAVLAIFKLYNSIDLLIGNFIDYRYKPIYDVLFALSVLAISIYFIKARLIKKE